MTKLSPGDPGGVILDSLDVPPRSLAEMVRDALIDDTTLNRTALAKRARMTPKTLRDILDGVERRYGEATLRGLDDALGWPRGTAWHTWRRDMEGDPAAAVADHLDQVDVRYAQLLERLERLEEHPPWVDELVDIGRQLNPGDRHAWMDLGHRLARQ